MTFDVNASLILPNTNAGRAFTPTLEIDGSSVGITYATQTGTLFILAPGLMFISARVVLSSKGSLTGPVQIRVPATDAAGNTIPTFAASEPCASFFATPSGTATQLYARIVGSSRVIQMWRRTGTTTEQARDTDLSNFTEFAASGLVRFTP